VISQQILIGTTESKPARTCLDIYRSNPGAPSGVYWMLPTKASASLPGYSFIVTQVYCDMDDKDENGVAGWTVIQRREAGIVSFNRTWSEYRDGFGSPTGSYWWGNYQIHRATIIPATLRVDLIYNGTLYKADYSTFKVDMEVNNYTLTIGGYSFRGSDPGDSLQYHSGFSFRTFDDLQSDTSSCPQHFQGGFWYHSSPECYHANCMLCVCNNCH
jgi:hypothetical protein